ncbi:hypothetical protein BT96DRAFT_863196, partial [Gymnopus androsaceus JB14]
KTKTIQRKSQARYVCHSFTVALLIQLFSSDYYFWVLVFLVHGLLTITIGPCFIEILY